MRKHFVVTKMIEPEPTGSPMVSTSCIVPR
jgi:hypothetical protein